MGERCLAQRLNLRGFPYLVQDDRGHAIYLRGVTVGPVPIDRFAQCLADRGLGQIEELLETQIDVTQDIAFPTCPRLAANR